MPLYVDIALGTKKVLFKFFGKCFGFDEESETHSLIIDAFFAFILVISLIIDTIMLIGTNRVKSDIWTNNFFNGLGQGMLTMPFIITLIQIGLAKSLSTAYVTSRPKLQKFLSGAINPDIKSIMVTLSSKKKYKFNIGFSSIREERRHNRTISSLASL